MLQSFQTSRTARFGSGGAILRSREALEDEQIMRVAPSVFATAKHESRSEKYVHIPTSNIIEGMRNEGFFPYEVRQGGSRDKEKKGFTKHMIRFRHQDALMKSNAELHDDSELFRELILLNSHDGTSSYQLMSGLFRMVCSNGLIRAEGNAKCIKIPHKGDIIGQVIDGAYEIVKDSRDSELSVIAMSNTLMLPEESRIFAEEAAKLRFDDNVQVEPRQVLQTRRRADDKQDLWTVFNRVQENLVNGGLGYIQRDENGRRTALRRTRPVNSVDGNVKLNQALWSLAEKMKELKAA